jgi:ABC-type Na+ efflux pump permease subunit
MTILPVAQRELRVAARQPRTYHLRTLTAAVAFVVVGYAAMHGRTLGAGTGGRMLFVSMTTFANLLCLMAGVTVTADAISRERREGTLGFLFLSHLSGFDVVLGKLAAQATHAFYALLAVMPMLALPMLEGGVAAGEFWFAMLALTNTLFFAVSLGLFTSSLCEEPRKATNAAMVAALFYWLGLPGLGHAATALNWPAWVGRLCQELSPQTALAWIQVLTTGLSMSPVRALLISHLEAWLFLALASLFTQRVWRERPAGRTGSRWQDFRRNFAFGSPARRAGRRRRLLERGAFHWLIARHRWKPVPPLALVFSLWALLGAGWWFEGGVSPPLPLAMIFGVTLHLLLKFWVGGEAAAAIVTHRRQGTLELLLSTPLTVRDIMRAQFRALRWQFGWPLALTAAFTAGYVPLVALLEGTPPEGYALAVGALAAAALLADAFTLVWLASWRAIVARRVQHAAGGAVFRVLVIPWIVLLVVMPSFRGSGGFADMLALWALIGFISDFCWWQWARQQLFENFRAAAERGYEPAPAGFWARLKEQTPQA